MWENLSAPSSIGRMGLNGDDSHPSVSSDPLMEDEEANQTITPKFILFLPLFFDGKSILKCFK